MVEYFTRKPTSTEESRRTDHASHLNWSDNLSLLTRKKRGLGPQWAVELELYIKKASQHGNKMIVLS